MHDDIDRRTSSRARSRAQLSTRGCDHDAKLRRFHDSAIEFPDFGEAPKKALITNVLTLKTGF